MELISLGGPDGESALVAQNNVHPGNGRRFSLKVSSGLDQPPDGVPPEVVDIRAPFSWTQPLQDSPQA